MAVLLNKSDMASSIGISVQAFSEWGVTPVERRGREVFYDVKAVLEIDRERQKKKQESPDGENNLEERLLQARIDLTEEQAVAQRLKNQVTEGKMVDTGFCVFFLSRLAMDLSSTLDAIPLAMQRKFRSLTVSILADLAKMEARIAASKLLGSVLGMFGFGASAGGSTPSGAYSSAALSVIPNADGGVYRSAGLSQYSGSIVNRPTFFAFARGAAVMGEAGPEAILPLRRGTDGKLGVVAAGSGGMAMFAPQYHIAISNTGPELTPQALKAVYDLGKKAAADFVQQQGRDGGRLSGAYR
ncbi:TPA: phage tail tape measure protein [Salmonella enterica]|nr:phage tail tape measure protein [Salmonella enterica subsp. enterica serovar Bahrenfeld]HDN5855152.1 phage tail tape measure protein [Salmonella enterica subsp. enterica serovar Bahrenfeld]